MIILQCTTIKYSAPAPGGTNYPALGGLAVLDWIERGTDLVLYLDCTEAEAQALVDDADNAEFSPRIVPAAEASDKTSEVNQFVWRDIRSRRDRLMVDCVDCPAPQWEAMAETDKQLVRDRRQMLCDITEQSYPAAAALMLKELEIPA